MAAFLQDCYQAMIYTGKFLLPWGAVALGVAVVYYALRSDRARGRRRCPRCWYDMSTLESLTCPECGHVATNPRQLRRTRPLWGLAWMGVVPFSLGLLGLNVDWMSRHDWVADMPTRVVIWQAGESADLDDAWWRELGRRVIRLERVPGSRAVYRPGLRPEFAGAQADRLAELFARTTESGAAGTREGELRHLLADLSGHIPVERSRSIAFKGIADKDASMLWASIRMLRALPVAERNGSVASALGVIYADPDGPSRLRGSGAMRAAALSELVAFVAECGSADPRALASLGDLLAEPSSRFDFYEQSALLLAIARLGPVAAPLVPRLESAGYVEALADHSPVAYYTFRRLRGEEPTPILVRMLDGAGGGGLSPFDPREFALGQLAQRPELPSEVWSTIRTFLDGPNHLLRVNAAELLIQRGKWPEQARMALAGEETTRDFKVFAELVDVYQRLRVPLQPLKQHARSFLSDPQAPPKKLAEMIERINGVQPDRHN